MTQIVIGSPQRQANRDLDRHVLLLWEISYISGSIDLYYISEIKYIDRWMSGTMNAIVLTEAECSEKRPDRRKMKENPKTVQLLQEINSHWNIMTSRISHTGSCMIHEVGYRINGHA